MVDFLANGLAIGEILVDNAGGTAIDTDGDGGSNKADEYVEIQNGSGSTVSLDGIEIWSEKDGLLFAFPNGETLAPGATVTVVGEYTGATPTGFYDAGGANNINFLQDGEGSKWDSIFLLDTTTGPPTYTVLSFGLPPRTPSPPDGFPTNAVQIGPGESINSSGPNGGSFVRNTDGDFVVGSPDPGTPDFLCIRSGALIDTSSGPVAIEDLKPGDHILGSDGAFHNLVAVGRIEHNPAVLAALPDLAPIELSAGTLGATQALQLSPNHCVLMDLPLADLLFDGPVLVPAKALAATDHAIQTRPDTAVIYFHLLFEAHIAVKASGVWVESLFLGAPGKAWIDAQRRAGNLDETDPMVTDRIQHERKMVRTLRSHEARLLTGSLDRTGPGLTTSARPAHGPARTS